MGKGKPRHNPSKPQNCGSVCSFYEVVAGKDVYMGGGLPWVKYCSGNPHNCKKAEYKFMASLPEHKRGGSWRRTDG